jgi:hypothetical protein
VESLSVSRGTRDTSTSDPMLHTIESLSDCEEDSGNDSDLCNQRSPVRLHDAHSLRPRRQSDGDKPMHISATHSRRVCILAPVAAASLPPPAKKRMMAPSPPPQVECASTEGPWPRTPEDERLYLSTMERHAAAYTTELRELYEAADRRTQHHMLMLMTIMGRVLDIAYNHLRDHSEFNATRDEPITNPGGGGFPVRAPSVHAEVYAPPSRATLFYPPLMLTVTAYLRWRGRVGALDSCEDLAFSQALAGAAHDLVVRYDDEMAPTELKSSAINMLPFMWGDTLGEIPMLADRHRNLSVWRWHSMVMPLSNMDSGYGLVPPTASQMVRQQLLAASPSDPVPAEEMGWINNVTLCSEILLAILHHSAPVADMSGDHDTLGSTWSARRTLLLAGPSVLARACSALVLRWMRCGRLGLEPCSGTECPRRDTEKAAMAFIAHEAGVMRIMGTPMLPTAVRAFVGDDVERRAMSDDAGGGRVWSDLYRKFAVAIAAVQPDTFATPVCASSY